MNPNQNNDQQPGSVFNPSQPNTPTNDVDLAAAAPLTSEPAPVAQAYSEPVQQSYTQPEPIAEPTVEPFQPAVAEPTAYAQPTSYSQPEVVAVQSPEPVQQPFTSAEPAYAAPVPAADTSNENTEKSYVLALALSYFFGSLAIDRFYLGKTGTAIAKLLTLGGFGIWSLVDLLLLAFGKLRAAGDDRPLHGFAQNYHWVKITAIILVVINALIIGLVLLLVVLGTVTGMQQEARLQDYNTSVKNQSMTSGSTDTSVETN